MLKDRLHYNDCSITDSCWHAQSIEQGRECCVTVEWLLSSDLLGGGNCFVKMGSGTNFVMREVARDNRICSIRIQ